MFDELAVLMVGTGTQHVVVLTGDSQEHKELPVFTEDVINYRLPPPEPKPAKPEPKKRQGRKVSEDHPMAQDDALPEEEEKKEHSLDVKVVDSTKKRKLSEFESSHSSKGDKKKAEPVPQPGAGAALEVVEEEVVPEVKQENVKRRKVDGASQAAKKKPAAKAPSASQATKAKAANKKK